MKQVKHVKEEQERKIEETISCKTRELESIKAEVDARQVELERRLMESDAQNSAMTKSLQERARKIVEANDAKERAETDMKVLQVKLGSCEKEISALKYELHVLNKDLEIRNEEVECNKKASDAAHKQHLDNVKKLAKLEADCQRLRNLIRKKLPGPAAIAQMRREVEVPQSSQNDMKRRSNRSLNNGTSVHTPYLNGSASNHRDIELLKDHVSSMEEETQLLRESLSKKNEELQAARLLCAKTANKLLLAEEQIESLQGTPRDKKVTGSQYSSNREPSTVSASEEDEGNPSNVEEASRAESWASALISELALFKKGKQTMKDHKREAGQTHTLTEVSASPEGVVVDKIVLDQAGLPEAIKSSKELSENLTKLQELSFLCKDLDCQLTALEERVRTWNPYNEDAAIQVKDNIISSINAAHLKFLALEMALQRFGNVQLCDTHAQTVSKFFTMDPTPIPNFRMVLSKLISLLETVIPLCKSAPKSTRTQDPDGLFKPEVANSVLEGPSHWDQEKQSLISSKDRFLDGKSNVIEFLVRLGIVLSEACDVEAADLQEMLESENRVGASEGSELTDAKAIGCLDELSMVRDQLRQVMEAKTDLESTVASTLQELEETKAKLCESYGLVANLQEQVAGLESLGKQLSDQEATKAQLQAKLAATEAEVSKLQASMATLTLELADKKQLQEQSEAKCRELEQQLQGRLMYEDDCNALKVPDSEAKEHELAAAKEKLAECQETILALGKQLSAMSSPPAEVSLSGSFDATSMDSASLMMEQRMRMDISNGSSMEHHQRHHHHINSRHHVPNNQHLEGVNGLKYNNGVPPQHHRRTVVAPLPAPHGVPLVWAAESKRRGYEDMQEQALSWSQHHGSYTRGARLSGPLAETDHHHHHQHHTYQQRSSSRPTYVAPSCQYSQRQYEGASSQLTWTAPSSYPEEEESQLALTVYSPPHTALSSPARSPGRYVQQLDGGGRGTGRSAVRTSLTESMNAAASSSADFSPVEKPPSKPSAFGKLFSKSKNHR